MAADLDPVLVRALNLLHSRHPKALEQLCALRDEVLGKKPEFIPEKKKEEVKPIREAIQVEAIRKTPHVEVKEVITISSDSEVATAEEFPEGSALASGHDDTDGITETVEVSSSTLAANNHPDDEIMETVEELGLDYVEETLEELGSSNLLVKRKRPRLEISTSENTILDGDSSPENDMSPDLAVSKCIVCMSGKSGVVGNQLVECHECHELFHQNCHKPHIMDQSINDPRHVWYCRNCSKQMKQAAVTSATSVPKLKPITSPGGASTNKPQIQSFKAPLRTEAKPSIFSPTSQSMGQSFIIPNLSTNAMAGSSGLKSPGNANPRDVARNSMKRLQLVRKKAAAKNQQRFTKR